MVVRNRQGPGESAPVEVKPMWIGALAIVWLIILAVFVIAKPVRTKDPARVESIAEETGRSDSRTQKDRKR